MSLTTVLIIVVVVVALLYALNRSQRPTLRHIAERHEETALHQARLAKQGQLLALAPGSALVIAGQAFVIRSVMLMSAEGLLPRWRLVLNDKAWLDVQVNNPSLATMWLSGVLYRYNGPTPSPQPGHGFENMVIGDQNFAFVHYYVWNYAPKGSESLAGILRTVDFRSSRGAIQTIRFEQLNDGPWVATGASKVLIEDIELPPAHA